MENSINKTGEKRAFNLWAKHSLMILIVGIFLLPKIASASPILPATLIDLTNAERQENGLGILAYNPSLARAAEAKADDILASGRFEHNIDGKKFSAWIKEAGYVYAYVGENLAIDFEDSEEIFEAWKDSETHYRNIMNGRFQEIGIAAVMGDYRGQETMVVVQIFGTPLSAASVAQASTDQPETAAYRIEKNISKAYYILSAGAKTSYVRVRGACSEIKNNFKAETDIHGIAIESFRIASMIFFTISLSLFYVYSTMHIFVLMPAARLDETDIVC